MKLVRFLLAAVAALATGCATLPAARWTVPSEALLAGPAEPAAPATPLVEDEEVLRVSPEMQAFLDRHVARGASRASRLRQLGRAILDEESLGLRYDESTRTASAAFRARRGNCLSFSTMFVALARRAGLPAHFQEVDTPPDWTLRGEVLVLNRHVNVLVDLGRAGQQVVDFSPDGVRGRYDRRRVSDRRALAHYDNNMAVERLQAGDEAAAFRYLRRAVGRDASFAPAWTNLGILHFRQGRAALAEAAYLRALRADGRQLVAMSNLATLYERTGATDTAAAYRRRVTRHRDGNPYYRYQLAREAVTAGDYDTAIRHLRYAVARRPREERFHALLGESYLGKGDEKAARAWFARAERISATDSARRPLAPKLGSLVPTREER
jgi:Flp pilus assembly protein TadD